MITINGNSLTLAEIYRVAELNEEVSISSTACENMMRSYEWVKQIIQNDKPVYGINTGFGIFADQRIKNEEASKLSRNLILSHSVGTGKPLCREITRTAMLVRANTLAKGFSGPRPILVQCLLDMLNKGVTPLVPEQGSMGSSGDLGPLSHLALVFTTDSDDHEADSGLAEYQGKIYSGKEAMRMACIERIVLGPKEGLALNNGATFSAAIAALAIYKAEKLFHNANIAMALSLEALEGCSNAFDERIHESRGQIGQIEVAKEVRGLIEGSTLIDAAKRVQDAYSLRCVPQVHGAISETINFVKSIIEREINATTDNPLLFGPGVALSGGNFHGEPVGLVMDFLSIALSELGAISERRVFRLTDQKLNGGLPNMLVDNESAAGLNSGLMMPQYTAASLVLENQTLSTPDSVHSLPTSGGQEDHNANSMTAARHCMQVLENTSRILAIELYTAARAMDLRLRKNKDARMGKTVSKVYQTIRKHVPYYGPDRAWGVEIEKVFELLSADALIGDRH